MSWASKQWSESTPIYVHLLNHLDPLSGKIEDSGLALPDEERRWGQEKIRWIAGGFDGAFGHHGEANNDRETAEQVVQAVMEIAEQDTANAKEALYTLLLQDNLLDYIDLALEGIYTRGIQQSASLHEFARTIARKSPDRGPVKFGIALLGIIADPQDNRTVALLGRHEEFTLFAAVALDNMLPDPEQALWELAQLVDGWGRIHLVERLENTDNPRIQDWMLREGFRNGIMHEYLAYTCAVAGKLRAALSVETVDDGLLEAAGMLINALVIGGPAEDMNDYGDAAQVCKLYLRHIDGRISSLYEFITINNLLDYLADEHWDALERIDNGWTEKIRRDCILTGERILAHPHWTAWVHEWLASEHTREFYTASRVAASLQINVWPAYWERLQVHPLESGLWNIAVILAPRHRIDQVLEFAIQMLPMNEIATGPGLERGYGQWPEPVACLNQILQALVNLPGYGDVLITSGLRSKYIPVRTHAIEALSAWTGEDWNPGMLSALRQASDLEPDDELRQRMDEILSTFE